MTLVQVRVHGLFAAAVDEPSDWIDGSLPSSDTAAGLIEALCQQQGSPLFDRHSCMAVMGGTIAPPYRSLVEGDGVDHYQLFSGG